MTPKPRPLNPPLIVAHRAIIDLKWRTYGCYMAVREFAYSLLQVSDSICPPLTPSSWLSCPVLKVLDA